MFAVGPPPPSGRIQPVSSDQPGGRRTWLGSSLGFLPPGLSASGAPDFLERDDGLSARQLGRDLIRTRRRDRANRD
ncbi:hypothetical protein OJAV_G00221980 [Oryzias javanicus]|uniref:Uncharacterized protein n=1 Tax=Oryzias javanicus TaxID=123683 RepID=A0A3S2NU25_ORYJA|nr:hypothetical protein OJAV_G00221980 [Oryzias javanicus]